MPKVFISYSRKDKAFAERLNAALREIGLDSWIDWIDIPPTSDWWEQIEKGIESADAFVFLLSPDSVISEVCGREINHAVKNGKRLIPLVARDVDSLSVPVPLTKLNWIFLREHDDFDTSLKKLEAGIKTDLPWVESHRRLQIRAIEWEKRKDPSLLLRGKDLRQAEEQLASAGQKDPQPTDLQRQYVLESRRRESRTRNTVLVVSAVTVIILAFLSVFAFNQSNRADNNALTAMANQHEAETAQVNAIDQRETAVANEQEAIRQSKLALARQLAAQAQSISSSRNSEQMIAVLLATQSLKMSPSSEAAQVLLNNNFTAHSIAQITPDGGVNSVTFSPDGKYVVTRGRNSALVWEATTGMEVARLPYEATLNSVTFSLDGELIITAGCDEYYAESSEPCIKGTARVWEFKTGMEVARMTHESYVYSVALSPDGEHIATTGCDQYDGQDCLIGSARIWEAFSGREIARMTHDDVVFDVAFSADGKYIVTGTDDIDDSAVHIWEVSSGREVAQMPHNDEIYEVAFSPDGKYVSMAGLHAVYVWGAQTGNEVASMTRQDLLRGGGGRGELREPNDQRLVSFSPDGKYVLSAGERTARVWEAATGKEVARMTHDNSVVSVDFNSDGNYVISGSMDTTARVWAATTGKEIARMTHNSGVISVDISPDGKHVLSASIDGAIRIWEMDTGNEITRRIAGTLYAAFSLDGKYMLSCGEDSIIHVWEVSSGREIARMKYEGYLYSVDFSSDGEYVLAHTDEKMGFVWESSTGKEVMRMADAYSVEFSPDGKYLASLNCDDEGVVTSCEKESFRVRVWEFATGKAITEMKYEGIDKSVRFSPDGKYVLIKACEEFEGSRETGYSCKTSVIRVWEAISGQEVARVSHEGDLTSVAFSPDGHHVVSGSQDGPGRIWEISTGKEITRLSVSWGLSFTGEHVISIGSLSIGVWEATTGQEVASISVSEGGGLGLSLSRVAFSPDGKYLVYRIGNSAHVLEVRTGKPLGIMEHDNVVEDVAFSPDGHYVVSGSYDTTVRVWETFTGREVARLTHDGVVSQVSFSPDGKYVASSGADRITRIWLWQAADLIEKACSFLPRNLYRFEWERYIGDVLPYQATCSNLPIE